MLIYVGGKWQSPCLILQAQQQPRPPLSPAHSPLHLRSLCLLRSLSFSPSPVSLSFMLTFTLCIVGLSLSFSRSHHLPLQSHRLTLSISLSSAHQSRTIHCCQSIQFFLLARRADRGRDSES